MVFFTPTLHFNCWVLFAVFVGLFVFSLVVVVVVVVFIICQGKNQYYSQPPSYSTWSLKQFFFLTVCTCKY